MLRPEPTRSGYRGFDVFGMPPQSSGGITVGETFNILEGFDLEAASPGLFWHRVIEASALAFADRNAYIADDRHVFVPQNERLGSTTHLVTADRWGNVVSYTLTIEQTGGFLLNNELTDFNFTGPSPNLAEPGKRPRSSMSPTIVLEDGEPVLAVGSPGGSTIITTVAEILLQRIDRGLSLPQAVAAPRATQTNAPMTLAEPAFIDSSGTPWRPGDTRWIRSARSARRPGSSCWVASGS